MKTVKDKIKTELNEKINEYKEEIAFIDEAMKKWIKGSDGKFYTKKIFNGMSFFESAYQSNPSLSKCVYARSLSNDAVICLDIYFKIGTNKRIDEKKTTEKTAKYKLMIQKSLEKLEDEQKRLDEYYNEWMQLYKAVQKFQNEHSDILTKAMPRIY